MTAGTRTLSQIATEMEKLPRPFIGVLDNGNWSLRCRLLTEALAICADRAAMSSTRDDLLRLIKAIER